MKSKHQIDRTGIKAKIKENPLRALLSCLGMVAIAGACSRCRAMTSHQERI